MNGEEEEEEEVDIGNKFVLTRYGEAFFSFLFSFFSRRTNGGISYLDFFFFFFYHFHERLKSFDQMVLSVDPNGSRYTAGIDRVIETRMFPVVRQGRKLLPCFLRKIHTGRGEQTTLSKGTNLSRKSRTH